MRIKRELNLNEWIVYLVAAIPPAIILFFIWKYGVNSLYWDDFRVFEYYKGLFDRGFNLSEIIVFQHNEHWMTVPVLVQCAIWWLTNCDNKIVLFASLAFFVASFLIVAHYISKKEFGCWSILPLSALFFAFKFSFIYYWPMCIQWPICLCVSLLSFLFFQKAMEEMNARYVCGAIFCGVLATLSGATGLLVWVSYLAIFLLQSVFDRPSNWKFFIRIFALFLSVGAFFWIAYFRIWNGHTTAEPNSIGEFIRSLLANLLCIAVDDNYDSFTVSCSAVLLSLIGVLSIYLCINGKLRKYLFLFLTTGYAFGATVVQTYARCAAGYIMGSQYCLWPTMFLTGGYLICLAAIKESGISVAPFLKKLFPWGMFFAIMLISFSQIDTTLVWDAKWHQANAYTVQNYDKGPDSLIAQFIRVENYKETLDWAKENEFFLFGDDRVYEYPFEDFYMAEELEELYLPSRKSPQGPCAVDHVNGASTANGEIMLSPGKGFDLDGWALDEDASNIPSSVYLRLNGRYYKLRQSARADVAEGYENMQLAECGFMGYVRPSEDLLPGEYPIQLIVIAADASSYYDLEICTIKVE